MIISVTPITRRKYINSSVAFQSGRFVEKRVGWNVTYHGRVEQEVAVPYTRTTNLITGAPLKKPVQDTRIERRNVSGVISRVVRRRSTLRKMGVKI